MHAPVRVPALCNIADAYMDGCRLLGELRIHYTTSYEFAYVNAR